MTARRSAPLRETGGRLRAESAVCPPRPRRAIPRDAPRPSMLPRADNRGRAAGRSVETFGNSPDYYG
ncbi:MAG UNVERIFIED_CONTAM: hypothetical protein LOD86_04120 [Thermobifida fusca]